MQKTTHTRQDTAFNALLDHYKKASLRISAIWLLLANLGFVLFYSDVISSGYYWIRTPTWRFPVRCWII